MPDQSCTCGHWLVEALFLNPQEDYLGTPTPCWVHDRSGQAHQCRGVYLHSSSLLGCMPDQVPDPPVESLTKFSCCMSGALNAVGKEQGMAGKCNSPAPKALTLHIARCCPAARATKTTRLNAPESAQLDPEAEVHGCLGKQQKNY